MPPGEPIEAKMVTKAVERAQNTVESRNAEIRRDILKYDEVMNEQRKAIYRERMRVIDGADLRSHTLEVLQSAVEGIIEGATADADPDEWDIDAILAEVSTFFPTEMTAAEVLSIGDPSVLIDAFYDEGVAYFEKREQTIAGGPDAMRQLERNIMLRIVDGKWREHLAEMDYLREGINLRAMGQQDPLVAWQREGFAMFQQLLASIQNDYARFVLRAEVVTQEQADLQAQATYSAPSDDGTGNQAGAAPVAARVPGAASAPQTQVPVRRAPLPSLAAQSARPGAAQPGAAAGSGSQAGGAQAGGAQAGGSTPAGVPAPRGGASRQQRRAAEREELKRRRRGTTDSGAPGAAGLSGAAGPGGDTPDDSPDPS
jgi:preprotein translocase subunit SecA